MSSSKKIIGTLVPLSALWNTQSQTATFEAGELFLDWLVKTKQNAWQLLPLHETQLEKGSTTKHVPSPYKGYGIGLNPRYLSEEAKAQKPNQEQLRTFLSNNRAWLADYALFCTLRDHFGTDDWSKWQDDIKRRNPKLIKTLTTKFRQQIMHYAMEQWQCHKAFAMLRSEAKKKGILLIGDVPYYIGHNGPLVWTHQDLFQLREDGSMPHVSGSLNRPNAYFGRQLWGHPLYHWENTTSRQAILRLWEMRLHYSSKLFDIIRLDHANGFFLYGSLDSHNPDNDEKKPGPGFETFKKIIQCCQTVGLRVYAEDAAVELKELRNALARLHVGGVRILRFALNEKRNVTNPDYAYPSTYPVSSCAYTSLHDTQPLMGYLAILTAEQKQALARAADVMYSPNDRELAVYLRKAVVTSPSQTVIIPIQDWLLTTDRINTPGTEKEQDDPNWSYRLSIPVEQLPIFAGT